MFIIQTVAVGSNDLKPFETTFCFIQYS